MLRAGLEKGTLLSIFISKLSAIRVMCDSGRPSPPPGPDQWWHPEKYISHPCLQAG